jgi:hypothetical protein
MRKLFVVSSSIAPKPGTFTYSPTRSVFGAEERFRQTIFTINSIQASFPNDKIVVVDSSEDYADYIVTLRHLKNVEYLPVKDYAPEIFNLVNHHQNKSLCECALLNSYYKKFKNEIKEYDYVIKTTGRYFYFNFNDALFTQENTNKIFFKKPLNFEWNDNWRYQFVDRRVQQNNNRLHQYCTVLYGFGIHQFDKFIDINDAVVNLLSNEKMAHYDIETLSYYFTRPFEKDIIETDWIVSGWDGTSARFMYY